MSKVWDDEERHFLQKIIVEHGCGREIAHDLMGRKYGAKYVAEGRGPYSPQRFWDEHTQKYKDSKPKELNRIIYQHAQASRTYTPAEIATSLLLGTDISTLAAQNSGIDPLSRQPNRQIILGGGGVAAYYTTGAAPTGPLAENTILPPQALLNIQPDAQGFL